MIQVDYEDTQLSTSLQQSYTYSEVILAVLQNGVGWRLDMQEYQGRYLGRKIKIKQRSSHRNN